MTPKPLVFQLSGATSGLIVLPPGKYQPATCCDGRMVAMIVNRAGVTRCLICDAAEKERLEHEQERQWEAELDRQVGDAEIRADTDGYEP